MALPFAHLRGRPMWERCDHDGTRIDGAAGVVRLAALPLPVVAGGDGDQAWEEAWATRRGTAVLVPCGPGDCEEQQVLLLDPKAGLLVLEGNRWIPLPFPEAAAQPEPSPSEPPRFQPLPEVPPERPAALARDAWDGLWLLDRPGRALRRLGSNGRVQASVALPQACDPVSFGCSALGLVVADRRGPSLLFKPWQGEWRGLQLTFPAPGSAAAGGSAATAVECIELAADPTVSWAAALVRRGSQFALLVWDGSRHRTWPAPMLTRPRHLLIDGPESVVVSEPLWEPEDSRPTSFVRLMIGPAGLEAEESFSVRGFDGRGLWRQGDNLHVSTASGAGQLLRRERKLRGEGRVETWALDSGSFACTWHRLFLDACLPAGTSVRVEARSSDDLPAWEVRRGARAPVDRAGDFPPSPPPPELADPWPPLVSLTADEQEGWQALGVPDRHPYQADQPLEDPLAERPSEDPLKRWRQPTPTPGPGWQTLEWLITTPPGRYLWLRVHLQGGGRRTPAVQGFRVTHPRPSLLDRLPAFWRADPEGGALSERLLALFEGPLTALDDRSDALMRLFLPALAPAAALPWLADFLALSFHDLVPQRVRRQLLQEIAELYRRRGTLPGLERLLSILAEAPVRIVEGFQLRQRRPSLLGEAMALGAGLELGGQEGLPDLEAAFTEVSNAEDERLALAHAALLGFRATVRQAGRTPCPASDPPDPLASDPLRRWIRQQAHRFTVLVPRCRTTELEAVLQQALEANKPAHTLHNLCWIEAGYRLGRGVRVGLHRLGPPSRAAPPVLGQALLGGGTDPLPGGPGQHPFLPTRSRQP